MIFVSIYLLFIKLLFYIDFFNLIEFFIANKVETFEIDENRSIFLYKDIILSFGYFLFGLIFDYYKFKPLTKVLTSFEILIPIIIIFVNINNILYYLISLFGLFIFASLQIILYSELTRVFGIISGPEILSINSLIIGIINLIMLCLNTFFEDKIDKFNIIYILGAILCFMKFIALFYFNENVIFSTLNSKENLIKIIDESF